MVYAALTKLHASTAIDASAAAYFTAPCLTLTDAASAFGDVAHAHQSPHSAQQQQQQELLVVRGTLLECYRIRLPKSSSAQGTNDDEDLEARARLHLVASWTLPASPDSIATLPARRRGQRDALMLAYSPCKLAAVEYDPSTNGIHTAALAQFEPDKGLPGGLGASPSHGVYARLATDRTGACAAALVHGGRAIALMKALSDAGGDQHDLATAPSASIDRAYLVLPSELGIPTGAMVRLCDVTILNGFSEPTLAILYEVGPSAAGMYRDGLKDTCRILAVSADLEAKRHVVIWRADDVALPSDAVSLQAVPQPLGGVIVICSTSIHYFSGPGTSAVRRATLAVSAYGFSTPNDNATTETGVPVPPAPFGVVPEALPSTLGGMNNAVTATAMQTAAAGSKTAGKPASTTAPDMASIIAQAQKQITAMLPGLGPKAPASSATTAQASSAQQSGGGATASSQGASAKCAFPDSTTMTLDGSRFAWLSTHNAMIALRTGELLLLHLTRDDMGGVSMALTKLGAGPPSSCCSRLSDRLVFLGSRATDSLVVRYRPQKTMSRTKEDALAAREEEGADEDDDDAGVGDDVDATAKAKAASIDDDEEMAELFGAGGDTASPDDAHGKAASAMRDEQCESYELKVADSIFVTGAIRSMTTGEVGDSNEVGAQAPVGRSLRATDLVAACGFGKGGSLVAFRKGILPDVLAEVGLEGITAMWTVLGEASEELPQTPRTSSGLSHTSSGSQVTGDLHAYLVLRFDGVGQKTARVLAFVGTENQEVTSKCDFLSDAVTTVHAAPIGERRSCMLQVHTRGMRLLANARAAKLIDLSGEEVYRAQHGKPPAEHFPDIMFADVCEEHILLRFRGGKLGYVAYSEPGAIAPRGACAATPRSEAPEAPSNAQLPALRFTACTLYHDAHGFLADALSLRPTWRTPEAPFPATGGVFVVACSHPSGAIHIYALPTFALVWKSYDLYEDRPLLLSDAGDMELELEENDDALAEAAAEATVSAGRSGDGGDEPSAKRAKVDSESSQALVSAAPAKRVGGAAAMSEADEAYVVELRLDDFGRQRHAQGPMLTVRRADGTVEVFTAFVAPLSATQPEAAAPAAAVEPSGSSSSGGAAPLRFLKHPRVGADAGIAPACSVGDADAIDAFLVAERRLGGAATEAALPPPPPPRLVRYDGVGRDMLKQHPLGLCGVFVCSKHRPYWVLCMRGGRIRVHAQVEDGAVCAFACLHNANCQHGFLYSTSASASALKAAGGAGTVKSLLKICQLTPHVRYDGPWPCSRKLLRSDVSRVAYLPGNQAYVAVVSRMLPCSTNVTIPTSPLAPLPNAWPPPLAEPPGTGDTQAYTTASVMRAACLRRGTVEVDELMFFDAPRAGRWVEDSWSFVYRCDPEERVQALCACGLRGSGASSAATAPGGASAAHRFLAVGTSLVYGEDVPSRGRIVLLELHDLRPHGGGERGHLGGSRKVPSVVCTMSQSLERFSPIATLAEVDGHLVAGRGSVLEMHEWKPKAAPPPQQAGGGGIEAAIVPTALGTLQQVAFHNVLYGTCVAVVKSFILLGDVQRGPTFLQWRPAGRSLVPLGNDVERLECVLTDFLVDGVSERGKKMQLGCVISDIRGSIHVYTYFPTRSARPGASLAGAGPESATATSSSRTQLMDYRQLMANTEGKLTERMCIQCTSKALCSVRQVCFPGHISQAVAGLPHERIRSGDYNAPGQAGGGAGPQRQAPLLGHGDGSMSCLMSISETSYKRLAALQKVMTLKDLSISSGAGVNTADVLSPVDMGVFAGRPCRPMTDPIVDIDVVLRFLSNTRRRQNLLARQAGTSRRMVLRSMLEVVDSVRAP